MKHGTNSTCILYLCIDMIEKLKTSMYKMEQETVH